MFARAGRPRLPERIETARLILRPLDGGDVNAIVAGIGNYDVVRWLSSPPYPYRADDARRFLGSPAARPGRAWAITEDGGFRGIVSIGTELGYWLAREAWGRGIMTEAGDAVVDAWFARPWRGALASGHFAANDASAGVLRKLGFWDVGAGARMSAPLGQPVPSREMRMTRAGWRARRRYRLRTPRLSLRELRGGDWRDVQRIGGHAEVAPNIMQATVPWPEAEVRRLVARSAYRGRPGFRLAIRRGGRMVGVLGLGRRAGDARHSVLYFLDPSHWGQGFATEAVAHFLADAMPRFGLETVEADHFADNPASGRVLTKLGFRLVGERAGRSAARPAPAPCRVYRLDRADLRMPA